MSFIMYTAGSTRGARLRSVSVRALLLGGGIAALGLLSLGAGLGYWTAASLMAPAPAAPLHAAQERARPALPFAIEQLGALSGRLFTLESLAGQLSTRLGATPAAPARVTPAPVTTPGNAPPPAGSGGPMLPPRPAQQALAELGSLQARLDEIEQQITRLSDAATQRSLALMRLPTRLPLAHAALVSVFGNRDDPLTGRRAFHAGLDFAAAQGTKILAAAGGTVALAGFRPDYGWVVEIEHGNGLRTRYAHASRLLVKAGDVVAPGETIAAVGSTGRSTGPHLHFELLRNGEATDPRRYLAGI
jgi:murein DD-endopeptidase MepM/ murein hydrolase activator NlpD